MGAYQIILTVVYTILFIFSIYYLSRTLAVFKKVDVHLFFTLAAFGGFLFSFSEFLLSITADAPTALIIHKIRHAGLIITIPFWLYSMYDIFLPRYRIIPKVYLFFSAAVFLTLPFNIFTSLPVRFIDIIHMGIRFHYCFPTGGLFYNLFAISMVIMFIFSIFFSFIMLKKIKDKIICFSVFSMGVLAGINDNFTSHGLSNYPMVGVFVFFIYIGYLFFHFLKEEQKNHLDLIKFSKDLEIQYKEAEHRLKITEIYTRTSIVEHIKKGEDPTSFQPKAKDISVLFSDIRNFTTLSEGLDPFQTVNILNKYFDEMNRFIAENNGEIDKLIGDCIMAIFDSPDNSVEAAIAMRRQLNIFNQANNLPMQLNNGIGINYGEVVLGNIGSISKMDYTVIGDIVNSASRLESLTKHYGVSIIISEALLLNLKKQYCIRFIDKVLAKGKTTPIRLYEVYDFEGKKYIDIKKQIAGDLQKAYEYYEKSMFSGSLSIYETLLRNLPSHTYHPELCVDPLINFYIKRCRKLIELQANNQLKEWKGVYEFADK
jgi:class 3 adenylate cyclase